MSGGWRCSACGCTTYHYSSERRRLVCDSCGHEIISAEDEHRQLHYLQTVDKAKDNLRVGNWDTAKNLIYPLLNDHTCDKALYLILLASVTKGYNDYLLGDANRARRDEAASLWDKLSRLNGVNSAMIEYSSRRAAVIASTWNKANNRILLAVFLVILGIVIASAFYVALPTIILLGFAILLVKKAIDLEAGAVFTEMRRMKNNTNGNPFE